jgi:hypothetical protein
LNDARLLVAFLPLVPPGHLESSSLESLSTPNEQECGFCKFGENTYEADSSYSPPKFADNIPEADDARFASDFSSEKSMILELLLF